MLEEEEEKMQESFGNHYHQYIGNEQWFIVINGKLGIIPSNWHKIVEKNKRETNHIERFNHTLRQRISRLGRKTLSFSKKLSHHIASLIHFIQHYNSSLLLAS